MRLLFLILAAGKPVRVCELADALGLPEYKASRRFPTFKTASFVKGEHRGPWVYYQPVPADLLDALRPSPPRTPLIS